MTVLKSQATVTVTDDGFSVFVYSISPGADAVVASSADATLTGTPRVFTILDGATPYYIKGYPTKT
jgi:hypothetical protein